MRRILPSLVTGSVLLGTAAVLAQGDDPFAPAGPTRESLEADAQHQIAIPEKYRGPPSFTVHVEKRGQEFIECIMVNGSAKLIRLAGHGISSPDYRMQLMKDGQWMEWKQFLCGTGFHKSELKPQHAVRFRVHRDSTDAKLPVRVGITYEERSAAGGAAEDAPQKTAWSEPIVPEKK